MTKEQRDLEAMRRDGATPRELKEYLDEREADKELQRRPYTNQGENHD